MKRGNSLSHEKARLDPIGLVGLDYGLGERFKTWHGAMLSAAVLTLLIEVLRQRHAMLSPDRCGCRLANLGFATGMRLRNARSWR